MATHGERNRGSSRVVEIVLGSALASLLGAVAYNVHRIDSLAERVAELTAQVHSAASHLERLEARLNR